ncbi:hypothetical protein BKA65DRAFT_248281 [Rhexocercosporidium sp. MPI-PUGE-AT-0058]|nr:hypothetical protein BKA65DRAFT_248281 [Rhexocercosporidium sp. MPI-PUGE-AT-0058]
MGNLASFFPPPSSYLSLSAGGVQKYCIHQLSIIIPFPRLNLSACLPGIQSSIERTRGRGPCRRTILTLILILDLKSNLISLHDPLSLLLLCCHHRDSATPKRRVRGQKSTHHHHHSPTHPPSLPRLSHLISTQPVPAPSIRSPFPVPTHQVTSSSSSSPSTTPPQTPNTSPRPATTSLSNIHHRHSRRSPRFRRRGRIRLLLSRPIHSSHPLLFFLPRLV